MKTLPDNIDKSLQGFQQSGELLPSSFQCCPLPLGGMCFGVKDQVVIDLAMLAVIYTYGDSIFT